MSAPTVRLDRMLAGLGYGSRREVQALVARGRVVLDGAVVGASDLRLRPTPDLAERMTVMAEPLDPPPGLVLMLNKPLGTTCSRKEAGPLVYGLLPPRWRRRDPALSTVGRLDKDTSGLLLLTDDGALLHRIISPRRHVAKRYRATLDRPLDGRAAAVAASGTLMLEGEDRPLLPARLESIGEREALVTVTEGRYHQVRRMLAALGNHVAALHREAVGGLALPSDLQPGGWRVLGEPEITAIFAPLPSLVPGLAAGENPEPA